MRRNLVFTLIFVFAYGMSACAQSVPPAASSPPAVEDQATLLAALQAEGTKIEVGDLITQDFFSAASQTIKVNGADLQVFQYENAAAMEKDASQVAPDGTSIGTSKPLWAGAPHFYKAGRIIVLYLGNDQAILGLLDKLMGAQFAGK